MKIYGVKLCVKETNDCKFLWFETREARDKSIQFYSKDVYVIKKLISDQMEFNFDMGEG